MKIKLNGYWLSGIALALSLLLHALLFGMLEWQWPTRDSPSAQQQIEAELVMPVSIPAAKPHKAAPAKPAVVKAKAATKDASEQAAMQQEISSQTSMEQTSTALPLAQSAVEAAAAVEAAPPAIMNGESTAHPLASSSAAVADQTLPNQAAPNQTSAQSDLAQVNPPQDLARALVPEMPTAPSYVDVEYNVNTGAGSGRIAITRVNYQQLAGGLYSLRSETEAKGLVSLFVAGSLVQTSSGNVTENGLQPTHFSYEYGKKADKSQQAEFDWQAGQLTMHTSKGDSTVPLPAGTQDLLSFMYQYMFVPPLVRMELYVTNGKKLSHYVYRFEGEEVVHTPLGELRALHIAKSSADSDEKTELWLSIAHHYLPIKIRKTEKDGKLYEQTVTRLSTQ